MRNLSIKIENSNVEFVCELLFVVDSGLKMAESQNSLQFR